ncbi:MAG: hypothetical protein AB7G47_19750 [Mycolicibacterium sp.]|uniref:hypothetical protein n=1 Tax=Mycolicibacterium sp. TaxID=2320850 RepID=UPI003D0D3815
MSGNNLIPKPTPATRPRRSSIAQAAHADPPPSPDLIDDDNTAAADTGQATAEEPTASPVTRLQPALFNPPTQAKRLGGSKDVLFSLPEEEKERMINTIAWTTPRTGIRHQSKFIRYAIAKACEDLEREFNGAKPFPPPADSAL